MTARRQLLAALQRGRPRRAATPRREAQALADAIGTPDARDPVQCLLSASASTDPWSLVEAELVAEGLLTLPTRTPTPEDDAFEPITLEGESISETLIRERR